MIKDTSEFCTVLHKSAHRLQVKRAVKDVIDNPEVGSKQQELVPVGCANFFQKFLVMTFTYPGQELSYRYTAEIKNKVFIL